MSRLELLPLTRDEANAFIEEHHRHHPGVVGHLFAIGCAADGEVVGVAVVGRPVARGLQDGYTAEVVRLCTDGTPHVASKLYAACWRAARAMGYRRLGTYILATETGTSLKAAGWRPVGEVRGRSWHTPGRPRVDRHPTIDKVRWEAL